MEFSNFKPLKILNHASNAVISNQPQNNDCNSVFNLQRVHRQSKKRFFLRYFEKR